MAKYSFESTTIGEVIETPALAEMFYELVPEAKDYEDIIEMGKGFTIEQALPFIENIADSLGILVRIARTNLVSASVPNL